MLANHFSKSGPGKSVQSVSPHPFFPRSTEIPVLYHGPSSYRTGVPPSGDKLLRTGTISLPDSILNTKHSPWALPQIVSITVVSHLHEVVTPPTQPSCSKLSHCASW